MKKKKKNIKTPKMCENCVNCQYIGEGDFICDLDSPPCLVMSDFCPTEDFMYCGGADYESEDDYFERVNKDRRKERNTL